MSQKPDSPDLILMSAEEVAAWLRTTPKAIYAMASRGQLPGILRLGRRLLFDRAELLVWLEEKRATSFMED